jgi:hypothetical protein
MIAGFVFADTMILLLHRSVGIEVFEPVRRKCTWFYQNVNAGKEKKPSFFVKQSMGGQSL